MTERSEPHRKGCQELEEAAQGSCRVTTPGSAQKICGCDIWGHGLAVDLAVLGKWLELVILQGFSSLNDSMIL